jgi:hypothetical protein
VYDSFGVWIDNDGVVGCLDGTHWVVWTNRWPCLRSFGVWIDNDGVVGCLDGTYWVVWTNRWPCLRCLGDQKLANVSVDALVKRVAAKTAAQQLSAIYILADVGRARDVSDYKVSPRERERERERDRLCRWDDSPSSHATHVDTGGSRGPLLY